MGLVLIAAERKRQAGSKHDERKEIRMRELLFTVFLGLAAWQDQRKQKIPISIKINKALIAFGKLVDSYKLDNKDVTNSSMDDIFPSS